MENEEKKIEYSLEPAYLFSDVLTRLIVKAGTEPVNEWFFFDGAFTSGDSLEIGSFNSWQNENFVVIAGGQIIGYLEGKWKRPLDIIDHFRLLLFDKSKSIELWKALYDYFDYLFECRGCQAFNWSVALQNGHAYKVYESFIKRCCGHRIGIKHHAQKSYTGKISDVVLYEMTREEFFSWKKKRNLKGEG